MAEFYFSKKNLNVSSDFNASFQIYFISNLIQLQRKWKPICYYSISHLLKKKLFEKFYCNILSMIITYQQVAGWSPLWAYTHKNK